MMAFHTSWSSNKPLRDLTICLRAMFTNIPEYKDLITLDSREIGALLDFLNFYQFQSLKRCSLLERVPNSTQSKQLSLSISLTKLIKRTPTGDQLSLMKIQSFKGGDIGVRKYTFETGTHFSFLQQLDEYNRPLLLPKKWHHYCLSFAEQTATFTQVLVSMSQLL